ncbi:MAG: hypothetical protein FWF82_03300 [Oscillospiraceae bacterium]|nr:hypothetical protein [Oscillospiraceae bacterium]
MEVNNNTEINKMFGSQDNPVTPPAEPALQASPIASPGGSPTGTPENSSPFQSGDSGYSDGGGSGGSGFGGESGVIIGDHSGFSSLGIGGGVRKGVIAVLVPLMLLLGFAGGVFFCYNHFFGLHMSDEDKAARTAMDLVRDSTESELLFTNLYINSKTTEYDCIVFVSEQITPAEYENTVYHVIIKKDSDKTDVIPEFDFEEFDRLDNGDELEQVQAQIMLSRHYDFERYLSEIRDGNKNWTKIDPFYLGVRLVF